MKPINIVAAIALLALVTWQRGAAGPEEALLPSVVVEDDQAGGKEQPQPPDKKKTPDKKPITPPPETDLFMRTPAPLSDSLGFNPYMLGDLGTYFAYETVTVTGTQTTTKTTTVFFINPNVSPVTKTILATRTVTTTTPVSQTRTILVPVASSAGAFKVAENESPRPVDRVFCTWNYFGGITGSGGMAGSNGVNNLAMTTGGGAGLGTSVVGTATTVFPATPRVSANLNREVFGFEKTFLDGNASIEMRMPLTQLQSDINGFGADNVGDVTIITKYAFLLDNTTGNVISGGLAITAPTGPAISTIDGTLHSTLLQPWFGYIWNADRFFIQAFHSVVVPTDARDITLLFNDVGISYWLYRGAPDQVLSSIVPLAEIHVTTPLDHRNSGPIVVPDTVIMTGGVHFGLFRYTTLALGIATPLSGPRPFNVEAFVNLNRRF